MIWPTRNGRRRSFMRRSAADADHCVACADDGVAARLASPTADDNVAGADYGGVDAERVAGGVAGADHGVAGTDHDVVSADQLCRLH